MTASFIKLGDFYGQYNLFRSLIGEKVADNINPSSFVFKKLAKLFLLYLAQ